MSQPNQNLGAALGGNWDARNVDPLGDFDPIPAGIYVAKIVNSNIKQNAAKTGEYLELQFEILTQTHAHRLVWANLNIRHPNPKAVEMALKELGEICRAINVPQPQNSQQLHEKPLRIKVALKARDDGQGMRNEIKGYKPAEGRAAQPLGLVAPPAPAVPPAPAPAYEPPAGGASANEDGW